MPRPVEPRPLKQHAAKSVFLRCPTPAWPLISTGKISEFRAAAGNAPQLWKVPLPTLAVVYRRQLSAKAYDYRLMLLERVRREALGVIDEAGLRAAGYEGPDAYARFRRDWMIGEKRKYSPLRTVFVFTVRPIQGEGDLQAAGSAILDHLYGEYLGQEAHTRARTIQVRPPKGSHVPGTAMAI